MRSIKESIPARKNLFLGNNELIIIYRDGIHRVIESDEAWEEVFTGSYEDCIGYCENRWADYQASIIG